MQQSNGSARKDRQGALLRKGVRFTRRSLAHSSAQVTLLAPETDQSLKNSHGRVDVLECHDCYGPILEIGKPLQIRLAVPLMTFLKLSGEALLCSFGTLPRCQLLSVLLIPDLKVRQSRQHDLKLGQKIVGISVGLCQRCKKFLRGRAMGHGCSPLFGTAATIAPPRLQRRVISRPKSA